MVACLWTLESHVGTLARKRLRADERPSTDVADDLTIAQTDERLHHSARNTAERAKPKRRIVITGAIFEIAQKWPAVSKFRW